jgi:hypothetical protein
MQAFQLAADEVLSDSSADEAEAERPVNDPPKAPKNVWEQAAMAESGDSEGWESSDESGDERLDCGDLGNDEVSWPIFDLGSLTFQMLSTHSFHHSLVS